MIVSHKHKFIFIKTRKTAGTSVEMALRAICGDEDIITPLVKKDEKKAEELGVKGTQNCHIPLPRYSAMDWISLFKRIFIRGKFKRLNYYNHMSAYDVKRYVGEEVWDSYYKFCFDRNPFDKFISLFYWVQWHEGRKYNDFVDFIESDGLSMTMGYDLYSINKTVAVDKVYKYEEMVESLEDVSRKLNLAEPLKLFKYKAKGDVRKDRRPSNEVLNKEEQKILKIAFAREMELLEYAI